MTKLLVPKSQWFEKYIGMMLWIMSGFFKVIIIVNTGVYHFKITKHMSSCRCRVNKNEVCQYKLVGAELKTLSTLAEYFLAGIIIKLSVCQDEYIFKQNNSFEIMYCNGISCINKNHINGPQISIEKVLQVFSYLGH